MGAGCEPQFPVHMRLNEKGSTFGCCPGAHFSHVGLSLERLRLSRRLCTAWNRDGRYSSDGASSPIGCINPSSCLKAQMLARFLCASITSAEHAGNRPATSGPRVCFTRWHSKIPLQKDRIIACLTISRRTGNDTGMVTLWGCGAASGTAETHRCV